MNAIARGVKGLARSLDSAAGRTVYGNTNAFSRNLQGQMDEWVSRRNSSVTLSSGSGVVADELRREGCAFLPELYPQSILAPLKDEFEQGIEDPSVSDADDKYMLDGTPCRWTMRNAQKAMPSLGALMTPELIGYLEDYYKSHFQVIRAISYRNYSVAEEIADQGIYANLWHCDNRRPSLMKLMLCLSDVTADDGPLHVLTKGRTRAVINAGFINRRELGGAAEMIDDPNHVIRLIGDSGTGLLCNLNSCMHKAGVPKPGHKRDLIQNYLSSIEY